MSADLAVISNPAPRLGNDQMRLERDRFLAFAFCRNDLLIELDAAQVVHFVGGPTGALLGIPPEELKGTQASELFTPDSRLLVEQLLKSADRGERIKRSMVSLIGASGTTSPPFEMNGYKFGDLEGHYFLALRSTGKDSKEEEGRDATGLMGEGYFAESAAERIKALQKEGEDVHLTLVNLPELNTLIDRLDVEAGRELLNRLSTKLQATSIGGDTAGRMGDTGFGVVHDTAMDIDALQKQLESISIDMDPEGKGLSVDAATTEIDDPGLSSDDIATGLLFTMNKFRESGEFTMDVLCNSLNTLASEASKYVSVFTEAVENEQFSIVFQPIADVRTGAIHHYEVLSRFTLAEGESPYQYIVFAEETNRIHTFDIAVVKKTVAWLRRQPINTSRYKLAINISGRSLVMDEYVAELHSILNENDWLEGKLMFEITESARIDDMRAANDFINGIRGLGYEVCLDDFGAGAASFQYLSSMEVDVVKLDGPAVKSAMELPKGRAFLSALTELCHKLNIHTIAEMIEDVEGLKFCRECGVDYVQGYLIGKPDADINSFKPIIFDI